jgi:hypothetical protein
MKQYKMASAVLITVPMFFLATFSAWAEPEPGGDKASTASAEEITPADAIDTEEAAEATGLDIVMDGSSLEAFEKSMEQVKATSSEASYRSLEDALDYLLLYDLGAQRLIDATLLPRQVAGAPRGLEYLNVWKSRCI